MKALTWTIGVTCGLLVSVAAAGAYTNLVSPDAFEASKKRRTIIPDLPKADPDVPPVASVPEAEYDFGVMNPETDGEHAFAIRNEGQGPLHLQKHTETCLCVGIELLPPILAPGQSGVVKISWNTRVEAREYRHGATIKTNDPNNELIKFRVNGRVKTIIGTEPVQLIFDRIPPDQAATRPLFLFSQEWESFDVGEIRSSMPGLDWELIPADDELLEKWRAKSGYRVHVTIPDDLPRGTFHDWLRFEVFPEGDMDHPEIVEAEVHGNIIRRLSVYGDDRLKDDGSFYFGMIRPNEATHARLMMNVRDEQVELPVTSITTWPEYLEVEVAPYEGASGQAGLYYLDITIPARVAHGNFIGSDSARLRLTFDHPRISSLELDVEFGVLQAN